MKAFVFLLAAAGVAAEDPSALVEGFDRASQLHQKNDYPGAVAAYQSLLEESTAIGPSPGFQARIWNGLGSAFQDLGRFDEAEKSYRRALYHFINSDNERHGLAVHVLANLGSLYLETRQFGRLRETCRTAAGLLDGAPAITPERARLHHLTGLALIIDGQRRAAETALLQSLAVWRGLGSAYARQMADSLNSLGTLAFEGKRFDDAFTYFEDALRQFDAASASPNTNRAATHANLACTLLYLRRYEEAETAFMTAMRQIERTVGSSHPYAAQATLSYASALEVAGRKKQAREKRKRAQAILAARQDDGPSRHVIDISDLSGQ